MRATAPLWRRLRRSRGAGEGAGRLERRAEDPLVVVAALDGYRGFAVLLVVLFHIWYASGRPALDGAVLHAVLAQEFTLINYLFALSGFVMFLPVVRRSGRFGSVRDYAFRRVARVVPAYYLSLIGLAVFWPLLVPAAAGSFWTAANLETWFTHFGFLQMELLGGIPGFYGIPGIVGFGINAPYWSMSIEAIFYAVLPLVAVAFFRRPFLALGCALVGQTIWRAIGVHLADVLSSNVSPLHVYEITTHLVLQFPGHMGSLAIGMMAAWVYAALMRAGPGTMLRRLRAYAPLFQVVALGLLFLLIAHGGYWTSNPDPHVRGSGLYFHYVGDTLAAALFAVAMVATAAAPFWAQWAFANPISRWLGNVSYGTYLWHSLIGWFFLQQFNWTGDGRNATFFKFGLAIVPLSILAGWLSYRFLEQPIIRAAKNRIDRRRARAGRGSEEIDRTLAVDSTAASGSH